MNKINPARGIRWIGARRSGYTSDLDDNLAASGAPSASKSKVIEQPAPVMPNPFRPDARATYFSTSMRSPVFSSTSARPGAMSIEAQYANQVPLERQGPIEMTTGEQIYGSPTSGLQSNIPTQYLQANAHEGNYLRQATLRPAAGPFSPHRSGDAASDAAAAAVDLPDWAVGTYSQAQWTALGPAGRTRIVAAHNRDQAPSVATQILTTLIQGGNIAVGAYLGYNQAERQQALDLAQQQGQQRLNELTANLAASGGNNPALQAQIAALTTGLTNISQQQQNNNNQVRQGLSTGLMVGLAVGGVVLLGGIVLLATRGGGGGGGGGGYGGGGYGGGGYRRNPSRKGRKGGKGH